MNEIEENKNEFEEALLAIRDLYINYPERLKNNYEQLNKLNHEGLDLAHMAEFANFNAYEGYKLFHELGRVRQERRRIKNENAYLEEMIKLNKQKKISKSQINETIGRIRKLKNNQYCKGYRMRVRKDLQHWIDHRTIGRSKRKGSKKVEIKE